MTMHVDVLGLDKLKQIIQILKDISDDERVPAEVREEVKTKVNNILESDM